MYGYSTDVGNIIRLQINISGMIPINRFNKYHEMSSHGVDRYITFLQKYKCICFMYNVFYLL
jgi:hypothetical protein